MYVETTHYKTFSMDVEKKDSIEMLDFFMPCDKKY